MHKLQLDKKEIWQTRTHSVFEELFLINWKHLENKITKKAIWKIWKTKYMQYGCLFFHTANLNVSGFGENLWNYCQGKW